MIFISVAIRSSNVFPTCASGAFGGVFQVDTPTGLALQ